MIFVLEADVLKTSLKIPGISVYLSVYLELDFRAARFQQLSREPGTLQSSYFAGVLLIIQRSSVLQFTLIG